MSTNQKILWLHIGWHKTGTSALQNELLGLAGITPPLNDIHYLRTGLNIHARGPGHHQLTLAARDGNWQLWEEAKTEIHSHGARQFIISAEGLRTLSADRIASLSELLSEIEIEIRILVYLRNPIPMFQSLYKQEIEMGVHSNRPSTFLDHQESISHGRLGYHSVLKTWATAFGSESMYIRNYDALMQQGIHTAADVFQLLTIPRKPALKRANPSLPSRFVEPLRRMTEALNNSSAPLDNWKSRNAFRELVGDALVTEASKNSPYHPQIFPANDLERIEKAAKSDEAHLLQDFNFPGFTQEPPLVRSDPYDERNQIPSEVWEELCSAVAKKYISGQAGDRGIE